MAEMVRPSEAPDEAVLRVLADREDCEVAQLGSLPAAVDVGRLHGLVDPPIEFEYCGYDVEVRADGTILVVP